LLTVELGFGKESGPFLVLFFHFVTLLFADLVSLSMLLPFEANFGFALFGS
jgi:hypothetical protein